MNNHLNSSATSRRNFIKLLSGSAFLASSFPAFSSDVLPAQKTDDIDWGKAQEIQNNIKIPSFKKKKYLITDHGAKSGGEYLNTVAINQSISICSDAGGGYVIIPKGTFKTGALKLKNNVNLHLLEGAELRFSTDPKDYIPLTPTWFEGVELMNFAPLISAFNATNIAITGKGLINGAAAFDNWWSWRGPRAWSGIKSGFETGWRENMPHQREDRKILMEMARNSVPVAQRKFGLGHYLRTSGIEFNRCDTVLIEGITLKHCPFWSLHPVLSQNITVHDITIENPIGPNSDGLDIEFCNHVQVIGNHFNTGDDCISLKSGRNHDGRRINQPCQNIVIRNNHFESERTAISCGSESTGGIKNVYIIDNKASDLFRLFRIKSNDQRGGVTENIFLKNFSAEKIFENMIEFQPDMQELLKDGLTNKRLGKYPHTIRNIHFENIDVTHADRAFYLAGTKRTPIINLTLRNINIGSVSKTSLTEFLINPKFENISLNYTQK